MFDLFFDYNFIYNYTKSLLRLQQCIASLHLLQRVVLCITMVMARSEVGSV